MGKPTYLEQAQEREGSRTEACEKKSGVESARAGGRAAGRIGVPGRRAPLMQFSLVHVEGDHILERELASLDHRDEVLVRRDRSRTSRQA